jgi:hypothetical protein
MEPLIVHRNDALPALFLRIYDQDNECYVDLSDATTVVTAKFRLRGSDTVLETVTMVKVDGGDSGYVQFDWPSDALTNLAAGFYEIEVSVAFAGVVQTVNRYWWDGSEDDDGNILKIRVKEDF